MRIGWVTGSAYEWTQHWRVATTAGIPPEDILAVRDWRNSERLTPADRAILAATDECLAGESISDAAWAEVAKHVTEPGQQVEFIIAMGGRGCGPPPRCCAAPRRLRPPARPRSASDRDPANNGTQSAIQSTCCSHAKIIWLLTPGP
jgi:Carboxymuconolactone decarboxylase family